MTKSQLKILLAQKSSASQVRAEAVVDEIFDSITEALKQGGRVEVRGFGTFHAKFNAEYYGRNPHSGESFFVKAKLKPVFRPSANFKRQLNK